MTLTTTTQRRRHHQPGRPEPAAQQGGAVTHTFYHLAPAGSPDGWFEAAANGAHLGRLFAMRERAADQEVTQQLLRDLRAGNMASAWRDRLRTITPMRKLTAAGQRVLQAVDGMRMAFVSNPLMYDAAVQRLPVRDQHTLYRLLLGGHLRVDRLRGPLRESRISKIGITDALYHYRIVAVQP